MPTTLITGAAGLLGQILWKRLDGPHELRGIDRSRSPGIRRADMTKLKSVEREFEGVDFVVDLAGLPEVSTPWRDIRKNNLPATMNALEAARRAGVRRVVFASSNHVTGMYERDDPYARIVAGKLEGLDPLEIPLIRTADPIRPDSAYGIGKAFGEAAARYYADTFGLSVVCLRIGTVKLEDRPTNVRELATLLTHADFVRLVESALGAPAELRFGVYYGVSANTWRFWDVANATEIGWAPEDDAERFRGEV